MQFIIEKDFNCLFFNCVRGCNIILLYHHCKNLLKNIHFYYMTKNDSQYYYIYQKYLLQTRDCINGKGERDVFYSMLCAFFEVYKNSSAFLLHQCCLYFGSWADVKYFCNFVKNSSFLDENSKTMIIECAIDMIIYQIDMDLYNWNFVFNNYLRNRTITKRPNARDVISFAAKWVPRETSKHKWLYYIIVEKWNLIHNPIDFEMKNINKSCKEFRKKVTMLNREICTTQTYLCKNDKKNIDPYKTSIHTILSNTNTFLSNSASNKDCFESFKNMIYDEKTHDKKNVNISLEKIVKNGLKLIQRKYDSESATQEHFYNQLWKKINNSIQCKLNCIPVVDVSHEESKFASIGLSILISQKSIHKKIIVVENQFSIIHIDEDKEFIDILRIINSFHILFFDIYNLFHFLSKEIEQSYCYKNIEYVILTHGKKIIDIQDRLCSYKLPIVYWNTYNNDNFYKEIYIQRLYLSGCTPKMIYLLENIDIPFYKLICKSLTRYNFINNFALS